MVAFVAVIFITGGSGLLAYTLGAIVIVVGWTGDVVMNRRAARAEANRE